MQDNSEMLLLKEEIVKLRKVIEAKNNFIIKLKRNSQIFEIDALNNEEELKRTLQENEDILKRLTANLENFMDNNREESNDHENESIEK